MARTRRKQPRDPREMESKFEAAYERDHREKQVDAPLPSDIILPSHVQQAKAEVEAMLNASKAKSVPASVQSPASDDPEANMSGGVLWWSGCTLDQYIPLSDYSDPKRQRDLQVFALIAPFCLLAAATMIKKVQALQWTLEGGKNLVNKWHKKLLNVENGQGWDLFIQKLIRSYLESDNGGIGEIIRAAPSWAVDSGGMLTDRGIQAIARGADAVWDVADLQVFDPAQIRPTRSREYPLLYHNPHTGKQHRLRDYNFVRLLDMPSVDYRLPGSGSCALSRAAYDVQEDRVITRYYFEKMSENPGAGMLFVNASETTLRTAIKQGDTERQGRGAIFYKGLIFIPVLNPEGTFSAEFISFSGLPDGFDRAAIYQELKERVATAYGLDPLDLGSISGNGSIGSGSQATVMASKSRGKGIGVIMQGIEREFRSKLLPESIIFKFEQQETEERLAEAEVHSVLFQNAKLYFDITGDPVMAQQYLVDTRAIPGEYVDQDITPDIIRDDTEMEKAKALVGSRVRKHANGKTISMEKQLSRVEPMVDGPLPKLDPTITESDITIANRTWDTLFPELAGMLNARAVQ